MKNPDPFPFNTDVILESLPDGFQAFDREWRYVYLNKQAEQILDRSREELLGKVCWKEYPEAVGTPFHQKYLEAMETGRAIVFEDYCPQEDTWVEFALHPYPGGLGAFTKDITDRKRADMAVQQSEQHYHALFEQVLDAVLLTDDNGVCFDANPAACALFGMSREELLGKSIADFSTSDRSVRDIYGAWDHEIERTGVLVLRDREGQERQLGFRAKANVLPGLHLSVLRDETEQRAAMDRAAELVADLAEERETLDTVNRIGRLLSAELDLDRLVQAATDAATELTGAQFGAFFFNKKDSLGDSLLLYTISGVPREAFSRFPMPRATQLFGPTFRGEGIIRVGDVTKDRRYGHMEPYHGMPAGHLPVRSYLALPVISRSGEVLGGLFFGHAEPDVFTEQAERNILALVSQLTVAMDNARLFGDALRATEQAQSAHDQAVREIDERKKAEEALARKATLSALRADISSAIAQKGSLQEVLQQCTDRLVEHLDIAFAGIWTLNEQGDLVAQASAENHPNGNSRDVILRFAQDRVDRIAREKKPDLKNDVRSRKDKFVEGMVAFAGYPLLIEERVTGVVALSARHDLPIDTLEELSSVADALAQVVERKLGEQRLADSESRQRTFLKDVLGSVTDGKLILCDSATELPERFPVFEEPISLSAQNLRLLRRKAMEASEVVGLTLERMNDLITAVSEAGMNAVVHAGGGIGTIGIHPTSGVIQVWVEDQGSGIDMSSLPRATLDRGYTTAGTLGHGFKMVLSTVDVVWLLTGPNGTTVVLSQGRETLGPRWLEKWMPRNLTTQKLEG